MKTDAAFFELFETNPNRLAELVQKQLPIFKSASSRSHKMTQEVRGDFVFEPQDLRDPLWIVEFQFYFDHSAFIRAEQSRTAVWTSENKRDDCRLKSYLPRQVKGLIIFGDLSHLPADLKTHPEIEYLVLDELIQNLRSQVPDSPLIALLAPLVDPSSELEKAASQYYDRINKSADLESGERVVMKKIFFHFITQVFPNCNSQQLRDMIAELTPIEETQVGKELIDKGRKEGQEEGREEGSENTLLIVAKAKFKGLNDKHENAIRSLEEKQLNELAVTILDFQKIEELEGWLDSQLSS